MLLQNVQGHVHQPHSKVDHLINYKNKHFVVKLEKNKPAKPSIPKPV